MILTWFMEGILTLVFWTVVAIVICILYRYSNADEQEKLKKAVCFEAAVSKKHIRDLIDEFNSLVGDKNEGK